MAARALIAWASACCSFVLITGCGADSRAPSDACADARTDSALRECIDHQIGVLQRELATALDSAKRRGVDAARLDSSQAAWLHYRKAQCDAVMRTVAPAATPTCWLSMTRARIDELQRMYR